MGILEDINAKLDQILEKMEDKPAPAPKKRTTKKKAAAKKGGPTLDEVKNAARELLKVADGKTKLVGVLEDFGAEKVVELDEEQYEEFIKQCNELCASTDDDDEDFDL